MEFTSYEYQHKLYVSEGFDCQDVKQETINNVLQYIASDPLQNSFLVYDPKRTNEVIREWRSNINWIQPRYAVKCNPLTLLLQDLDRNDFGFDVASQGELERLLSINVNPNKIIYSNPYKNEKYLQYAYQNGVRLTVADTVNELEKIKRFAPEMKVLWRISLQEQHKAQGVISFASKFGDPMNSTTEIRQKFQNLFNKGYRLYGIHFHAGSGHDGSKNFGQYLERARECFAIAKEIGHPMETIDVGGGFAGNKIGDSLLEPLQTVTKNDELQCQYLAEPGRHVASRLFSLCCRVIAKKEISENKVALYVNDGIYHGLNKVSTDGVSFDGQRLFQKQVGENFETQVYKTNENNEQEKLESGEYITAVIYGQTCDSLDVVARDVIIPKNIEIGDWFLFGGMGAYTYSLISNFNSMESLTSVLVLQEEISTPDVSILDIIENKQENEYTEENQLVSLTEIILQAQRESQMKILSKTCSQEVSSLIPALEEQIIINDYDASHYL